MSNQEKLISEVQKKRVIHQSKIGGVFFFFFFHLLCVVTITAARFNVPLANFHFFFFCGGVFCKNRRWEVICLFTEKAVSPLGNEGVFLVRVELQGKIKKKKQKEENPKTIPHGEKE